MAQDMRQLTEQPVEVIETTGGDTDITPVETGSRSRVTAADIAGHPLLGNIVRKAMGPKEGGADQPRA